MYFDGKAALLMRMRTWWKLLKGTVSGVYSEELEKRDYEFFIFIFPSYDHCLWWYMERWMRKWLWVFLRLSKIDGTSGPFLSSFYHLKFSLSWFMAILLILSTQDWICILAHRWRQWHLTPVLLPGKSHGWRSLVGCSPWGPEESERLHFHWTTLLSLSCIGEGNGNPLQCSCLENRRDGGAWWAAVYGVAQNKTRLKQRSSSSSKKAWALVLRIQMLLRND